MAIEIGEIIEMEAEAEIQQELFAIEDINDGIWILQSTKLKKSINTFYNKCLIFFRIASR